MTIAGVGQTENALELAKFACVSYESISIRCRKYFHTSKY